VEDEELTYNDVVINVGHLRRPFVEDLAGVITACAREATGDDLEPKLTPEETWDLVLGRLMELVDLLVHEVVQECMAQMAEQTGGIVLESTGPWDEVPGA
jgi:hypothetical protein